MPLTVEIWSDVVCPWCYIGKRRFEAALASFGHAAEVAVTWRAFELDPEAPAGYDRPPAERLAEKYGQTVEQALASHAQLTELAAAEGLEYHLDRTRGGNTFDAHRVIALAAERGFGEAAMERIMRGYFTEGEAVGDHETLVRLVADAGVDAEAARSVLAGDAYADAVRADELLGARMSIRGVPFFVLDRRYGVSGAQPAELLVQALDTAWAAAQPDAA
jgi:predicted DsbA family dithiol-disulfide isomerase